MSLELLNFGFFYLGIALSISLLFIFFPRRNYFFVRLIRTLTFLSLIIALANPQLKDVKGSSKINILFDISDSISEEGKNEFLNIINKYFNAQNAQANIFAFAKTFEKLGEARRAEDLKNLLRNATNKIDTSQTNLASSLKSILETESLTSVVLATDGYNSDSNLEETLKTLKSKNIAVDPIVPNEKFFLKSSLSISSLYAPLVINAEEKAEVLVSIKNNTDKIQEGTVELFLEQDKAALNGLKSFYKTPLKVSPREEKLIKIQTPQINEGMNKLSAKLMEKESSNAEPVKIGERSRWISVKEKSKVLLFSGSNSDHQQFAKGLSLKGYPIEGIVAGRGEAQENVSSKFSKFSLVILNNTPKESLPRDFLTNLKEYVAQGGGLIIVGGDQSFGLGNYLGSILEEISPLKFLPPQTQKKRLRKAVVLLVDKSRSMNEEGRLLNAKKAAITTIYALNDEDEISVIGFDAGPFRVIKLSPVSEVKNIASERLSHMIASGATNPLGALAEARIALKQSSASIKHVILLSDGEFEYAGTSYIDAVKSLAQEGISVSTIALGADADVPTMKNLTQYGKGRFYHILDSSKLADFFIEDIKVSTGELTMREQVDFAVEPAPNLISTKISSYPQLRGLVETKVKDGANLELFTRTEQSSLPVLASWNYGKGKVLAFTSDSSGRWSQPWVRWESFLKFWSDLIESAKIKKDENKVELDFDIKYSVSGSDILLDFILYGEIPNQALPNATVEEPDGRRSEEKTSAIKFLKLKEGRYFSKIENARPGDYKLEINLAGLKLPKIGLNIPVDLFPESPGKGLNYPVLSSIASITGGKFNPEISSLQGINNFEETKINIQNYFIILTFCLIMLEAFIRELYYKST